MLEFVYACIYTRFARIYRLDNLFWILTKSFCEVLVIMSAFSPPSKWSRNTSVNRSVDMSSEKPRFDHTVRFDDLQERIKRMDRMLQDTQGL